MLNRPIQFPFFIVPYEVNKSKINAKLASPKLLFISINSVMTAERQKSVIGEEWDRVSHSSPSILFLGATGIIEFIEIKEVFIIFPLAAFLLYQVDMELLKEKDGIMGILIIEDDEEMFSCELCIF